VSGAEWAENRVEQSMDQATQKTMELEVAEWEQSGEPAESIIHSPLQPNISLH